MPFDETIMKRHAAAVADAPASTWEDYNWACRVNTWEMLQLNGAFVAALLRDPPSSEMRAVAPALHDLLMELFPADGDTEVIRLRRERDDAAF